MASVSAFISGVNDPAHLRLHFAMKFLMPNWLVSL